MFIGVDELNLSQMRYVRIGACRSTRPEPGQARQIETRESAFLEFSVSS
jgi:hypothetical protein